MQNLISSAPDILEAYDTSTDAFQAYLGQVIDWYTQQNETYAEIDARVRKESGNLNEAMGFRIALKIAESRRIIAGIQEPVTVILINPVYKETGRMQRRSEHPHGEDSIRFKLSVLEELESLNPQLSCRLLIIDDGCPEHSGKQARAILEKDAPEALASGKVQVLDLSGAIEKQSPALPPGLTHKNGPNRSVKGGAVLFGMRTVLGEEAPVGKCILIDNDADLSIHPGQIGLLLEPILAGRAEAVAGSRREKDSVALIGGSRNNRGRLFIQIWQHLLPGLGTQITDTNRAFKAFTRDSLARIINQIEIYTFPYQIELCQASISAGIPLEKRGIAYADSEAASTQQGDAITETYLNQIHQIIDIARRYQTIPTDDALLTYLESISEERWQEIEAHPPERIEELLG